MSGDFEDLPGVEDDASVLRQDMLRRQADDLGVDALDAPVLKRIASRFLKNAFEALLPAIAEAVEKKNWPEAREKAHQLKGSAPHLGAEALAKAGRALEQAIQEEHFERACRIAKALPGLAGKTESQLRETVGPLPKYR